MILATAVLATGVAMLPSRAAADASPVDRSVVAHEIGALESKTVALLLSGNQGGEVAGAVLWTVIPSAEPGGTMAVPLYVDVDGTTLLDRQQGPQVRVGFFAYALTGDGRIASHFSQGVTLDLEAWDEPLRSSGLKFVGRLQLPAGSYSLRVLVRNQDTGRLFLTREELEVPSGEGDAVTLLPPLFPEPASLWVEARQSSLSNDEFSLDLRDERLIPAARAVLVAGTTTELVLGGSGWEADASVSARVMDLQGRHLTEPAIEIDGALGQSSSSVSFYRATLAPIDVPLGSYRLVITVTSRSGMRAVRSTPVVVIPSGGSMVWAAIDVGAEDGGTDTSVAITLGSDSELEPEALATRYLHALRLLAEGNQHGAVEAVADLERTANAIEPVKALEVVRRVEAEIALELGDLRADTLVPVVLLHRAVFRSHLGNSSHVLADHAATFTSDLAEAAADAKRSGISPDFAETVLVSMAGDLVSNGSVLPALRLLERALDRAPECRDALLGKGVALERLGRFREAIDPLESLVEADPEHAEGSLRLAVNLARTGREKDAELLFRRLIEGGSEEWLVAIAYQEHARTLVKGGRGQQAESVVRAGIERLPNNQPLRILLAYLLDSSGRPWEATVAVENLRPRSISDASEPRLRYVMWPILEVDVALVRFARQAEELQPDLLEGVVLTEARRAG